MRFLWALVATQEFKICFSTVQLLTNEDYFRQWGEGVRPGKAGKVS